MNFYLFDPTKTEIAYLYIAIRVYQNIRRFHVSMYQLAFMKIRYPLQNLVGYILPLNALHNAAS